jgi:N-acetylglutamate synthase-like GNAT family acetyltransferase
MLSRDDEESRVALAGCDCDVDVLLRDGEIARIRSVRESDAGALRTMYDGVSEDTLYLRFFIVSKLVVTREIAALTRHTDDQHGSLVAEIGGRIVGVATFERQQADPTLAEIAFLVSDDYRGRGLGTLLLAHLAVVASSLGVERFFAETLPTNARMLHVFADSGFPLTTTCTQHMVRLEFPLARVSA